MKTLASEFRIEEVNEMLARVQGLGFDLPKEMVKAIGAVTDVKKLDPKELRIEDTNKAVNEITGGLLEESK